MYKVSTNPKIEELTRNHKGRSYSLSDLKPLKLDEISKNCIWCLSKLTGNRYKWCSETCIHSALAWGRPSGGHGLYELLIRQDFSCAVCKFLYKSYMENALNKANIHKGYLYPRMRSRKIDILVKIFKRAIPKDFSPEVDHTVPIWLGGQAIGLDNHQILCRQCHKIKTSKESKIRIAMYGHPKKGVKITEKQRQSFSIARKGFDSINRRKHRDIIYEKRRIKIIAINVFTKEEVTFDSITCAAKYLKLQISNISRVLREDQNRKQHKGWTFKYV